VCVAAIRGAIALGNAVVSGLKGEPSPTSSAATSGAEGSAVAAAETELIAELETSGVKFSRQDLISIARDATGRVVFLEEGNSAAGLQHILEGHEQDFAANGISAAEIPDAVMAAVTRGSIIGYEGEGVGRPIYEVIFNGQVRRIAVTVGSNGFIVGANPSS
jgi:hypothetical protein